MEKNISNYIESHPSCKLLNCQPLILAGKRHDLHVFRLPTCLLRYNVRNGRFAAEYRELKNKLNRELDPNNTEDAEKIAEMLLKQDLKATQVLKEDLLSVGQKSPGVLTCDGYLINGNRRKAIIEKIYEETGDPKWEYLEVSILPKDVDEKDVWRIEAGLQFSRDERLDYGPINKLLKFREGKQAGLKNADIARSLYGGFKPKEIKEDLERLTLIENYLDFIGKSGHYTAAEGLHEHFIDLQKIIKQMTKVGVSGIEKMNIVQFAFDLIRNGISHLDLRNLNKIMKQKVARNTLITEIKNNPEISSIVNPPVGSTQNPGKIQGNNAPTVIAFYDSYEVADAAEAKNRPNILLKKALRNLEGIHIPSLKPNDKEIKGYVESIDNVLEKIRKKI